MATWTPHDTEVKVGDWLCLETEWQGLTDDEIDAIMEDDSVIDIACALEAKLKEKNHE